MGKQFDDIEIKVISKPRHEYQSVAYSELGLPKAPAIMLDSKVLVTGSDIEEEKLIAEIRQQLRQP